MDSFRTIQPYLDRPDDRNMRRAEGWTILLLFLSSLAGLWPAFLNRVLFDRAIPYQERRLVLPVMLAAVAAEAGALWSRRQADRLMAAGSRRGRYLQRVKQSGLLWKSEGSGKNRDQGPMAGTVVQLFEDAALLGDLRTRFLSQVIGPVLTVFLLLPAM